MTAPYSQDEEVGDASSVAESVSNSEPQADSSLETLREILFSRYRQRIATLEEELAILERRVTDKDALVAAIAPVLGDAIRHKIRDAREEMIEALYPIIGETIVRAVSEAIRDLARSIDAQLRSSFDLQAIGRRFQAQTKGVSGAEMLLRESLPFEVAEVFLIHRETGLLLWHISRDPGTSSDSDLISGMLTAIGDFVQDAFGQGQVGQLDEIQYGQRRILIEAAQHVYLAVVVDGIEPPGFRAEMRERTIEVQYAHEKTLRHYEGDPTPLAPVDEPLKSLMRAVKAPGLSASQKRILGIALGVMLICVVSTCLIGGRIWQVVGARPTPVLVVVEPTLPSTLTPTLTATPTTRPTFTATPTLTNTSIPTAIPPTATFTPTPTATPAPVIGLMIGNVWLREEPIDDSPRLGVILEQGQSIQILAVAGGWYQVRWAPQAQAEVVGWVPARWVGTIDPIPVRIITPVADSP